MSKNLELKFGDDERTAAKLEAEMAKSLDPELAKKINATVNAIPRFVPNETDVTQVNEAVKHYLAGAKRALEAAETAPNLASSPATSVPILGKLWGRIRGQMHELILFYVNRSGATSGRVDGQLIQAIETLSNIVAQQQAEIESLKRELEKQKGRS